MSIPATDPSGLSPDDVERLRSDTPASRTTHHLNNAGSALPPQVVVDTVVAHLRREAEIGGYEAHAEAQERVDATYDALARLVSGAPDEIAVTASATDSWLRAFLSLPLHAGDRVLVSQAEYASNVLAIMSVARRTDAIVEAVPDDASGVLDLDALRAMLDERVRVVAVTHAPSHNGLLNPAEGVGRVLSEAGSDAWYLLDACQSAGQVPLDVRTLGADFVSATGRKFLRGPRGTGFLWTSDRARSIEPALLDLHAARWTGVSTYELAPGATRYENWEKSYAGVLGLGAAATYALDLGIDVAQRRIAWLAEQVRARVGELPGVRVHDRGVVRTGIVTFSADGRDAEEVAAAVTAAGVHVSHSPREYAVRDFDAHGIAGQVRVSPHVFTVAADIDALVDAVRRAT